MRPDEFNALDERTKQYVREHERWNVPGHVCTRARWFQLWRRCDACGLRSGGPIQDVLLILAVLAVLALFILYAPIGG